MTISWLCKLTYIPDLVAYLPEELVFLNQVQATADVVIISVTVVANLLRLPRFCEMR